MALGIGLHFDVDSETYIGHARSYSNAGHRFAKWHGLTDYRVSVDIE